MCTTLWLGDYCWRGVPSSVAILLVPRLSLGTERMLTDFPEEVWGVSFKRTTSWASSEMVLHGVVYVYHMWYPPWWLRGYGVALLSTKSRDQIPAATVSRNVSLDSLNLQIINCRRCSNSYNIRSLMSVLNYSHYFAPGLSDTIF